MNSYLCVCFDSLKISSHLDIVLAYITYITDWT